MALMVIASPLSCFRPPPDPPPYESPLFEDLSPIAPPEPPDPPDAVYVLVPLQIPNTSAKPSLVSLPKLLFDACLSNNGLIFEAQTGLLSILSRPSSSPLHVVLQFNYAYYSQLTFILLNGLEFKCAISHRRCDFFLVSSLAFGAVILLFSSRWQLEEKRFGISHLVNMVLMDIDFSVVSWLEHFIFPKFPLVWSELEAQALLVLQGSFSQLMLFSAFGAEMVILWITLDAILLYPPLMEFEFF
ncbi:hypothetical protein Bca4012_081445 [Brassica carinata]